ncbi:MAG: hypothetical protein AAGG53_00610 [Cyanobacteria bacterium P01_H01_bin.152]
MWFKSVQQSFTSRFQGWLLFGAGLVLVCHSLLSMSPSFAQESDMETYTGRSPQAVMTQFLDEAPEEITAETLVLSEAGEYALATYVWGEGGGFIVMQKDGNEWETMCAGGGALSGADLVNLCKVPLAKAQALWTQFAADSEEAGYAL